MDDVVDAGRQADLFEHLGQQRRSRRGFLGGLDHHGVSARERGRNLPGQEKQRQVPRNDHGDDAERLADRVVQRLLAAREVRDKRFLSRRGDDVGEGAEVRQGARDVEFARLRDRLAGVRHLCGDELFESLLDPVGSASQQSRPLSNRRIGPTVVQSTSGRGHGPIDQGLVGLVDPGENTARCWVDLIEARRLVGFDIGAIHVIADPSVAL